ncbi:ribosomal RNA methyltransferase, putative [Perkinsus marinus ATCC 50983]|uniref:Ribosomal RNA methyltransferase, putative n=1 Tax=Perkinsus marinus (strain ATCC 50983 / TXsc) TaxID=423536 RepID=C5KXJ8_PERM5|nr:ribosomal RNA methyltransferase, putative [Perkinsus marinus ATCC 50983]EER10722.1 ribosomal RNA methyltransferase, putative [Perkinsus marinus ATCC 50983]|eukprot:XP_002778927.1 ribosomal RNA methyltransferase, putative [Perkinsus marinus ATCC 50983]
MVRRKKVGKERLDRFYQLAKEQGYRARSAFKLIQLEKKYGFLKNARSCVDLCGAPGGWSQVAVKHMPANSKVICVDLMPIKPIKGVVTMQCDITTQKCRQFLLKELNGTPCDVVLNDGAPNVGASWAKDAYNQAELCLYAVHLAADMLRKGGTFVTKVFRSSDYNSLLWVFQQLFEKVEATKPTASRNVSAEIFVTCKGFKAPARVDPRLFDPKWVFMMEGDEQEKAAVGEEDEEEITGKKAGSSGAAALNDYLKSAMKRRRGGYEDESELFSTATVAEFIASPAPAEVLIKRSKLVFATEDCEAIRKSPYTTPEILDYMSDLKVLGKGELMALLKWRMRIRSLCVRDREKASKVDQESEGEEDEEDTLANARPGKSVDDELAALLSSRRREEKAELKKQRERTKKQEMRKKMSLGSA